MNSVEMSPIEATTQSWRYLDPSSFCHDSLHETIRTFGREASDYTGRSAEHVAESTTEREKLPRSAPEELKSEIAKVFRRAQDEHFEDGMESTFSRRLECLIENFGDLAVTIIAQLILREVVSSEVASEALRWIGLVDHPATRIYRLWLLREALKCSSSRVRDGAILGISFMDDPSAIESLVEAIEREKGPELRQDMQQVLRQLEETRRCQSS